MANFNQNGGESLSGNESNTPGKSFVLNKKKMLGTGAFGTVFQGTYKGVNVAVKRVLLERVTRSGRAHETRAEDVLLKRMDHPNVIKLLYWEEDTDFAYYVLELCEFSLDQYYSNEQEIKKQELQTKYAEQMPKLENILLQLAEGLHYIHKKNVVHRDIKPHNVLVKVGATRRATRLKLTDFGLGKSITQWDIYSFSLEYGTEGWIAPELLKLYNSRNPENRHRVKGDASKSDIFSAGCLFFYIATCGDHPFGERATRNLNISENRPTHFDRWSTFADVDEFLVLLIRGMIRHEPSRRLSSEEIAQLLRLKKLPEGNASVNESLLRQLRLRINETPTITAPSTNESGNQPGGALMRRTAAGAAIGARLDQVLGLRPVLGHRSVFETVGGGVGLFTGLFAEMER